MASIIVFTLAMMLKGGWLGRIPGWNDFTKKKRSHWGLQNAVQSLKAWMLDGTQLSTFLVFLFMAAARSSLSLAAIFGVCWWLIVLRSMGEEAGAVGDYKRGWGPYVDPGRNPDFRRSDGVRGALAHGVLGGALLALATGWLGFIPALGAFPLCYYAGNSLTRYFHKTSGWAYSEILYGAVIGLAVHLYLGGAA